MQKQQWDEITVRSSGRRLPVFSERRTGLRREREAASALCPPIYCSASAGVSKWSVYINNEGTGTMHNPQVSQFPPSGLGYFPFKVGGGGGGFSSSGCCLALNFSSVEGPLSPQSFGVPQGPGAFCCCHSSSVVSLRPTCATRSPCFSACHTPIRPAGFVPQDSAQMGTPPSRLLHRTAATPPRSCCTFLIM